MRVGVLLISPFVLQDYETDLAAYSSGLDTLLNIPVKRTMLTSPTMDLNVEVIKLEKLSIIKNWNNILCIY